MRGDEDFRGEELMHVSNDGDGEEQWWSLDEETGVSDDGDGEELCESLDGEGDSNAGDFEGEELRDLEIDLYLERRIPYVDSMGSVNLCFRSLGVLWATYGPCVGPQAKGSYFTFRISSGLYEYLRFFWVCVLMYLFFFLLCLLWSPF